MADKRTEASNISSYFSATKPTVRPLTTTQRSINCKRVLFRLESAAGTTTRAWQTGPYVQPTFDVELQRESKFRILNRTVAVKIEQAYTKFSNDRKDHRFRESKIPFEYVYHEDEDKYHAKYNRLGIRGDREGNIYIGNCHVRPVDADFTDRLTDIFNGKLPIREWDKEEDGWATRGFKPDRLDTARMARAIQDCWQIPSGDLDVLSFKYKYSPHNFYFLFKSHDAAKEVVDKMATDLGEGRHWIIHDGLFWRCRTSWARIDPSIPFSQINFPAELDLKAPDDLEPTPTSARSFQGDVPPTFWPLWMALKEQADIDPMTDISQAAGLVVQQPASWWALRSQDEDKDDRREQKFETAVLKSAREQRRDEGGHW
ncbi:hypothetical protein HDV00_003721 [Rhizophlyctis rosea]|nr:hypothetical protein HDV00_003721 [Rhizophlyctis rosea]